MITLFSLVYWLRGAKTQRGVSGLPKEKPRLIDEGRPRGSGWERFHFTQNRFQWKQKINWPPCPWELKNQAFLPYIWFIRQKEICGALFNFLNIKTMYSEHVKEKINYAVLKANELWSWPRNKKEKKNQVEWQKLWTYER